MTLLVAKRYETSVRLPTKVPDNSSERKSEYLFYVMSKLGTQYTTWNKHKTFDWLTDLIGKSNQNLVYTVKDSHRIDSVYQPPQQTLTTS